MNIQSLDLLGNSSIGIFGFSTETYAIFPYNIHESKLPLINDTLDVPIIHTTINNSNLIGLYGVGNSHHLLLPSLTSKLELNEIEKKLPDGIQVSVIDSTITALGNVIITIEGKTLISTEFSSQERRQIADTLDSEVESMNILNSTIVGSLIFGTKNGLLVHPLVNDDELDFIEDFFKVQVDVVTVNRGTPYPRPGIIGNSKGVLVGSDTTGPELMRIFDVLF